MPLHDWIVPDWQAPTHVRAICTTRNGGCSKGQYRSMNPASHVNDDVKSVNSNRALLQQKLSLLRQPHWLQQVHSTKIIDLDQLQHDSEADGSTTTQAGTACVVMTADCLPVLLTDRKGMRVMAIHAGWRGLADGILEAGVRQFSEDMEILAWLGPAIGPDKFEVGAEVVEQLSAEIAGETDWYRNLPGSNKYLVDLYKLARYRLQQAGAAAVTGGGYCTFSDEKRFYSYRRQGDCGRMATLVWLDPQAGDEQTLPS